MMLFLKAILNINRTWQGASFKTELFPIELGEALKESFEKSIKAPSKQGAFQDDRHIGASFSSFIETEKSGMFSPYFLSFRFSPFRGKKSKLKFLLQRRRQHHFKF